MMNSKYLHGLIYIVADQPANKNLSPSVPLVGTDSYKTLLVWLGSMDVDVSRVRFYNQVDGPFDNPLSRATLNQAVKLGQIKVIALGQKASGYLLKANVDEFFVLPHPSSKNRILNDKQYIATKLGACRKYIYEGVIDGEPNALIKEEVDVSETV